MKGENSMMRERYESLPLKELREIAKARGLKSVTAMRKAELIDRMCQEDEKEKTAEKRPAEEKTEKISVKEEKNAGVEKPAREEKSAEKEKTAGEEKNVEKEKPAIEEKTVRKERAANKKGREEKAQKAEAVEEKNEDGQERKAHYPKKKAREGEENKPADLRKSGTRRKAAGGEASDRVSGKASGRKVSDGRSAEKERYQEKSQTAGQQRSLEERVSHEEERREKRYPEADRYETKATETVRDGTGLSYESERISDRIEEGEKRDEPRTVRGILEVLPDGYGFIRSHNFLPGDNDVYVSPSQIRKFNMKTGDFITGSTRRKASGEKFSALIHINLINDLSPAEARSRRNFEDMIPIFPNERIRLERPGADTSMRIVDLVSPIGKGQRGMIVSPPKAGKTTLLKQVAKSVQKNNPDMHMIILLIDERPEEVTDMKESIQGENVEVIYSTFDELPEHHKRVSEMVIERAKRLVEHKKDVVILLDSITRLARAYNLTVPPSGRTLSGGLDPAALHMPKRFFGAARNMREGGSLTILATALVDTGSKMDDVVYEEFKGTGNMELILDRKMSEKRIFPAIDIVRSGTRREDLLLDREEQEAVYYMRRGLNGQKSDEAVESLLNLFVHTKNNREFCAIVKKKSN